MQELQELRPRLESEAAAGDLGAPVATAEKIIRLFSRNGALPRAAPLLNEGLKKTKLFYRRHIKAPLSTPPKMDVINGAGLSEKG